MILKGVIAFSKLDEGKNERLTQTTTEKRAGDISIRLKNVKVKNPEKWSVVKNADFKSNGYMGGEKG